MIKGNNGDGAIQNKSRKKNNKIIPLLSTGIDQDIIDKKYKI